MRASLTIGGIEVALATAAGSSLEKVVARRYAPFLGAVEAPVCSLLLEANRRDEGVAEPAATLVERVDDTSFRVVHPGLFGVFDLKGTGVVDVGPDAYSLDSALRLLFGLLAPRHDALLLHATSVIGEDGIHVFMGGSERAVLTRLAGSRPVLTDGLVMVRRDGRDGWLAASTPFWASYEQPGPPREGRLSRLWSLVASSLPPAVDVEIAQATLAEHIFLPTSDLRLRDRTALLIEDVAADVPLSALRFSPGPAVWAEVDASAPLPAH